MHCGVHPNSNVYTGDARRQLQATRGPTTRRVRGRLSKGLPSAARRHDAERCTRSHHRSSAAPIGESYHQDELFNVVAITAGQNGTTLPRHAGVYNTGDVIERIKYGDYGNPTVMQGASGTIAFTSLLGNRFMFTGREYDGELGWSYYRTRYLEHEWGRFTTRDVIGVWGDALNNGNPSAYVTNAPARYSDPFGLQTIPLSLPQLVAAGYTAEEIAAMLGLSVATVLAWIAHQQVTDLANDEFADAVRNLLENAKTIFKHGGCAALQSLKDRTCKGQNSMRNTSCKGMNGTKDCRKLFDNAVKHAMCVAARMAMLQFGCAKYKGVGEADSEIGGRTAAGVDCMLKYLECEDKKSTHQQTQRDCKAEQT